MRCRLFSTHRASLEVDLEVVSPLLNVGLRSHWVFSTGFSALGSRLNVSFDALVWVR